MVEEAVTSRPAATTAPFQAPKRRSDTFLTTSTSVAPIVSALALTVVDTKTCAAYIFVVVLPEQRRAVSEPKFRLLTTSTTPSWHSIHAPSSSEPHV